MKPCVKCQSETNPFPKTGTVCKVCLKARKQTWYLANKARINDSAAARYTESPDSAKKRAAEYRANNKEEVKDKKLFRLYGIGLADYRQMLERQDGKCAICGSTTTRNVQHKSLAIDHNHETNKIRGLLCHHCNAGIGHLGDSIELLQKAIDYLKEHS